MSDLTINVADDILRGAKAIGRFLLPKLDGDRVRTDKQLQRCIFHLLQTTDLPVFRVGGIICARKSALLKWLADQEEKRAAQLIWRNK
jgi:hypothetical protein